MITKVRALSILFVMTVFISGCDNYPKDVQHSFDNIKASQRIRVGVIEQSPWAIENDTNLSGIEIEIINAFATSLDVTPQWLVLSEAQATLLLEQYKLDVVVGGLTEDNPRKDSIAFTRPYLEINNGQKHRHVMAVPKGENRLMVTLERFLSAHKETIHTLYQQAEK